MLLIGLGLLIIFLGLWVAYKTPAKRFGESTRVSENRPPAEAGESGVLSAKEENDGQGFIDDGFEVASEHAYYWNKGESKGGKAGRGGFQHVYIDHSNGAENSKRSLVMEFSFGIQRTSEYLDEKIKARIKYRINKDLSEYSGIRFYIKSDPAMNLLFLLVEKDIRSLNWNRWYAELNVTEQWRPVDIVFGKLKNADDKTVGQDTYRTLELKNTDSIEWLVTERMVPPGAQGKIWLDQIRLY